MNRAWTTAGIDDAALESLRKTLPASRLWSLLLDVMERRAAQRTPASLTDQWSRDSFTQPAYIDQRTLVALDGHLLEAAHAFEAIELSPLAPLGSCSVIGLASQNKIVSALRGTEVVSDPTNVLALECAKRLREAPDQVVRFATCHRCVRAQEVPKQPGFAQHFRIFCLATAGHEQKDRSFVVAALVEHITTFLRALDLLERHGYEFPNRTITLMTDAAHSQLGDRIAAEVAHMPVTRQSLDHAYYHGLRFQIGSRSTRGADIPLIDGGAFDWVGKLTSNRKLVFVASGMGSQLAAYIYRTQASAS